MITFDPVTPAPLATRIARVVVPLLLCFAYLAFRAYPAADGRIPLGEAIVMGLVLMGLAMVACIALGDLIYPAVPRARRRATSEELEITAVHAPVADADTVVAATYAAELARFDALIGYATTDAERAAALYVTLDWEPFGFTEGGVTMRENVGRRWVWMHDWAKGAGVIQGEIPPDVRERALTEDTQPFETLLTHEFHPQHHTPPGGFAAVTAEIDDPTALHVLRGELFDAADTGRHHKAGE